MISYIMMDANNLKKINDSLGHNKGDELIITIAKCMRAAVGQNGQCYRIGGDEFVINLKNKTAEETEEIIRQVRARLNLPMNKVTFLSLLQWDMSGQMQRKRICRS